MQQIYYIHNVVQMQLISYIHNVVQFATDLLCTQRIKQRCAYATNIFYTQRWQMATLDAPKVLLLTNKTKLTLTVTLTLTDTVMQKSKTKLTLTIALTLTDTVMVIFFMRILSTPMKRLYRNNKRPDFFRFLTCR